MKESDAEELHEVVVLNRGLLAPNVRSRRVPERLGFLEEGVLREAELIGDRYIDHVVYSLLVRDWDAPTRNGRGGPPGQLETLGPE